MKEAISGKIIWNNAMKAGIILGLVSITYMFLGIPIGKISPGFLSTALVTVLWIVKFVLCIWLMAYFMKRLVSDYDGVTNSHTFKYGIAIALLSAFVYSTISMFNMQFISHDEVVSQLETQFNSISNMLDSNSKEVLESIKNNIVQITFIGNFIWCLIYGTILSSILSSSIPSKDPFTNYHNEDTTDNQ
jgi:hypothetical protein